MWHNHNALSQGLGLGLIRWIERLAQRTKDPQLSTYLGPGQRSTTVARSQVCRGNVGATGGRVGLEGGRPAYNCHRSGHVTNTDLRKQSGTSVQRRWPDGRAPRPAGPTLQSLTPRLRVEDKHTDLTCLQLTLRGLTAKNRPWKAINRGNIHHLYTHH